MRLPSPRAEACKCVCVWCVRFVCKCACAICACGEHYSHVYRHTIVATHLGSDPCCAPRRRGNAQPCGQGSGAPAPDRADVKKCVADPALTTLAPMIVACSLELMPRPVRHSSQSRVLLSRDVNRRPPFGRSTGRIQRCCCCRAWEGTNIGGWRAVGGAAGLGGGQGPGRQPAASRRFQRSCDTRQVYTSTLLTLTLSCWRGFDSGTHTVSKTRRRAPAEEALSRARVAACALQHVTRYAFLAEGQNAREESRRLVPQL